MSIVWVIGAGITTLRMLSDQDQSRYAWLYGQCATIRDDGAQHARERCAGGDGTIAFNDCMDEYKRQNPDTCSEFSQESIPRDVRSERIGALFVAFAPIPFAWGFAYFILFLVRWIKRGFQDA